MGAALFHVDGWIAAQTDLYNKVHSYVSQFCE